MDTVASADGTTIAFEQTGDGPPLVFVMGAFCDRTTTAGVASLLASDFTVYSYDRRGRGASGDTAPYAVQREIEDLAAVLGAVDGPVFVFGHSSGAILSLEAAAQGLPIAKLVAYEPPYIVDDTRRRPVDMEARVRALVETGRRGEAIRLFMTEAVEAPPRVVARMEADPSWAQMEAIAHTLPYDLAIVGDQHPPTGRLASIGIPTLVLSGAASPEWARNSVQVVAETVPGGRRRSLEGQTHNAADAALAPVLSEFFRD